MGLGSKHRPLSDRFPQINEHETGDVNMRSTFYSTLAAAFALPALAAQTEPAKPTDPPPVRTMPQEKVAADYVELSDVIGANVAMLPGAKESREAAEEGDVAKRPKAEIDDVLVDTRTGDVSWAVVSFGGFLGIGDKTVVVPCSALTWNAAEKRFNLQATEDQIKGLPEFDLGKAKESGLDSAVATVESRWQTMGFPPKRHDVTTSKGVTTKDTTKEAKEAAAKRGERVEGVNTPETAKPAMPPAAFNPAPFHLVCGSEIDGLEVYGHADKFGKVTEAIVDRNAREVALLVVSSGGVAGMGDKEYLLPFDATTLCRKGDDNILCVDRSAEQLKTGVEYKKPKDGVVDASAALRARQAFVDADGKVGRG
jgi:hypothetical protein